MPIFVSTAGAIYTSLNRALGVQNDFLDATLGPGTSFAITLRWLKNIILALVLLILIWLVLSPKETSKILNELSFGSFKEFAINENLPMALLRQFIFDGIFGIIGFGIYWMIARNMNNKPADPVTLFLVAFGLQDPEGNSRSLPKSEALILQGYHDMLKTIDDF